MSRHKSQYQTNFAIWLENQIEALEIDSMKADLDSETKRKIAHDSNEVELIKEHSAGERATSDRETKDVVRILGTPIHIVAYIAADNFVLSPHIAYRLYARVVNRAYDVVNVFVIYKSGSALRSHRSGELRVTANDLDHVGIITDLKASGLIDLICRPFGA